MAKKARPADMTGYAMSMATALHIPNITKRPKDRTKARQPKHKRGFKRRNK